MSDKVQHQTATSGALYGLGVLGAWVYFWQEAEGFWWHIFAIIEGFFWPAFIVHEALSGTLGQ